MTDNEVLAESIRNYLESGVDLLLTDNDYRTIIKALEQEPKTGHWTFHEIEDTLRWYECDQCMESAVKKYNYCPNCGAKMVEPQESEVSNG